jgi:hypothetical protein
MPMLTDIFNQERTLAVDGVELRAAILSSKELDSIKAEVSVDHEILRRILEPAAAMHLPRGNRIFDLGKKGKIPTIAPSSPLEARVHTRGVRRARGVIADTPAGRAVLRSKYSPDTGALPQKCILRR